MTRKLWIKTLALLFATMGLFNLPQMVFGDDDTTSSGNFFVNFLGCKAKGSGEVTQD